ncbi:unnamed protein product [Lactuca saligna]|uniref:Uncharacterized protein n=1 Tax=Lactuca saligna TaxID=75948 RepID=A0AA35VUF3_LACSI|nr:unnamed protein product [Lactuca saligna]
MSSNLSLNNCFLISYSNDPHNDNWSLQGYRISLNKQIINHQITISQLFTLNGKGSANVTRKYLNQCIYTIGMGNNDYISNYFVPNYYETSSEYTPEEYAEVLVEQYSRQLQELYESGARKFGIFAAGYSGCCPGIMADYGLNSCVELVNNAVKLFNTLLNTTLNDLNNRFLDAKFILIDARLVYPSDLNVTDKPCCEIALRTTGKGSCVPNQVPCSNRQNYIFWDAFHPTERVNVIDGTKAYETLYPFYTYSEAMLPLTHTKAGYEVSDA